MIRYIIGDALGFSWFSLVALYCDWGIRRNPSRNISNNVTDDDKASAPEGSWLLWNAHTYSDEAP